MKIFKKKEKEYLPDLVRQIEIPDIKRYLQEEYQRAQIRENFIKDLEEKIVEYELTEQKYNALLVVQEETSKRTLRLDNDITEYRDKINKLKDENKILKAENTTIQINYKQELKKLSDTIKELKKEISVLKKSFKRG